MRYLFAMLAGFGLLASGCNSYPSSKAETYAATNPSIRSWPVVVTNPEYPVVSKTTLGRLTLGNPKIVADIQPAISSIRDGLPYVQKISQSPVLAVTEQDNWFFYATEMAIDKTTYKPVAFMSGYAIKRSGRQVIEWSIRGN